MQKMVGFEGLALSDDSEKFILIHLRPEKLIRLRNETLIYTPKQCPLFYNRFETRETVSQEQ